MRTFRGSLLSDEVFFFFQENLEQNTHTTT